MYFVSAIKKEALFTHEKSFLFVLFSACKPALFARWIMVWLSGGSCVASASDSSAAWGMAAAGGGVGQCSSFSIIRLAAL